MRSVAVLALALGVFTLDAGSSTPVSADEPGSATLTSQLLPGWNMVAWLGPEAPVSELFDAIPALRQVSAWDSEEQRYRQALRTSTPRDGLTRLTAGMGLWLRVGGVEPVEWTRPLSEGHVLLSLRSGLNLVGWTGRDGESFAESAGTAGDALVLASRWNAETQSYELFGPPAKGSLRLNRGEAIWVELNDDARWWQSATFEFASDIPADQQVAIRDEMLRAVEFFEERFAIEPGQLSVAVGVGAAEDAGATAASIAISSSAAESRAIADTLAREYFHLVRQDLAGGSDSPAWMTAGASGYAVGAYRQARGETTAPGLHAERWLDLLYTATPTLPELEGATSLLAAGAAADSLGALAAEWLVERAGEPALFEYQRLLPASESWAEAFEAAFGTAVDDFYEAFAQHRERRAPPGSDRSDGRTEPALTFLGDVPDETEAAIGREFQALQSFFRERFGDWPGDYRVDVAADWESAAPQYSRPSQESRICVHPFWPSKLLVILPCPQPLPDYVARFHFENVRERLAPGWNSTPPTADGTPYHGPLWLNLGAERYVEYAYLTFADPESADQHRAWYEADAAQTAEPLRSLETMVGTSGSSGPGFLAAEWLALRAGDEALFEYYWLLQFLPDWRDAFEMAFGLTVEEFYEAFARHRSELAPPLPHLADDRNEPVLVLLGDIAPEVETTVRAQFEGAQEFFGERLGAPPADYTVYVAADDESAAAPFRKVFGRDPDPGFCFTASTGAAMVIALDCGRSLAHYLGEYHFRDVREQLLSGEWTGAPRSHGPKWLRLGAEGWAEYTFMAASGAEPLDRIRAGLVRQAARTAQPLSTVLGSAGADLPYEVEEALGFFAVEQLVARAGEKSVLEYYRLLLTSEDWEEAFEGAFGITVEEFYEAFAEVRDELTALPPGDPDYVLPLEGPVWLNYGRDAYAEYASLALVGDENPDWVWSTFAGWAVWTTQPLSRLELVSESRATGPLATRALGFLAVEWLVEHAGEAQLLEYQRLLRYSSDWREAFEGAFGMTVGDFYAAFAQHRSEVAPVIPHRADDRDEPMLVFVGEVPEETRAAVRAEFQTAQDFFGERLGAGPADYSVYVAADTASATRPFMMAYRLASGSPLPERLCHRRNDSVALFITLECGTSLAHYVSNYHFSNITGRIANDLLVPPAEEGLHFWGPDWLWRGLRSYIRYAYHDAAGVETLDETRRSLAMLAVRTTQSLRSIESYAPTWRAEELVSKPYDALAFFAADRLVERAGETAIFEYFRLLSASEDWEEAFDGAFGITVEEFYESFEDSRSALDDLASAPGP